MNNTITFETKEYSMKFMMESITNFQIPEKVIDENPISISKDHHK